MAKKKVNISKLSKSLQEAGAVNLDMKVSELLKIKGIGDIDPLSPVATTVVAWDGYAVILANQAKNLKKLKKFKNK